MASKMLTFGRVATFGVVAGVASVPAIGFFNLDTNKQTGAKIQASQLPIYANPEDKTVYEIVEETPSAVQESVSTVRKATWQLMDSNKEAFERVSDFLATGKAHTQMSIGKLTDDPYGPGIIFVAAFVGYNVASFGRRRIRGLFVGTFAGVAAASLYYPRDAVDVYKNMFNSVKDKAYTLWTEQTGSTPKTESTTEPPSDNTDKEAEKKS